MSSKHEEIVGLYQEAIQMLENAIDATKPLTDPEYRRLMEIYREIANLMKANRTYEPDNKMSAYNNPLYEPENNAAYMNPLYNPNAPINENDVKLDFYNDPRKKYMVNGGQRPRQYRRNNKKN